MLLFLVACTGAPDSATTLDSTDPGGDAADYCEETGRTPVTDRSVPSDGFTFAAGEVVNAFAGAWSGTWAVYSGGGGAAAAGLAYSDGAIEGVTYQLHQDTSGMGGGAEPQCASRYEIAMDLAASTDDGQIAEAAAVTVVASESEAMSFNVGVDIGSVGGTTRPSWDPSDWATNTLSLDGSGSGANLTISATWQASSGARGPVVDTASAGTETGTVEPSGMTEGVGSMSLTPG